MIKWILPFLFCSQITSIVPQSMTLMERIKKTDPILYTIATIESNNGKNLNHPRVTRGLNKGHKAGGPWGMMPLTAKDVIRVSGKFKHLLKLSPDQITVYLNNHWKSAYILARIEWEYRYSQLGDERWTVYSWKYGLTATKNTHTKVQYTDPYVIEYLFLREKIL